MSGDLDSYGVHLERNPTQRPEQGRSAFRYAVTPAYFETAGIPLLRGRLLEESRPRRRSDRSPGQRVFGEKPFPGRGCVGQRVRIGPSDSGPFYTIVGVVGDVKQMSLMRPEAEAIYVTLTQWRFADNVLTSSSALKATWRRWRPPFAARSGQWTKISRSSASQPWTNSSLCRLQSAAL